MSEREDVIFLGRHLGSYEGWDGDSDAMTFYEFRPPVDGHEAIPKHEGTLVLGFNTGTYEIYSNEGDGSIIIASGDIVPIVAQLPIHEFTEDEEDENAVDLDEENPHGR